MRRDCHFALLCVIAFWCGVGRWCESWSGAWCRSRFGAVLAQFWRRALVRGCRFSGDLGAGVPPALGTLLSI